MWQEKKLTDRDVYEYYKKNRKKTAPGINQYNLFVKAVGGLLNTLKHLYLSSDTGVYLNRFGYICVIMNPKLTRNRASQYNHELKSLKKRHSYHMYFLPDDEFKYWQMNRMFPRKTNEQFIKNVNMGKKYQLMLSYIEQIKNAKKESKKARRKCQLSINS